MRTPFIAFLFIGLISYSQSSKDTSMKNTDQPNPANYQTEMLLYEKVVYFTVKQERSIEFEEWIIENQEEFAKTLPKGWKYLGCYRTMFHSGRHGWQIRYEIEGMVAYDNLMFHDNETSDRLFGEIYDFIDRQLPMEVEILKKVNSEKSDIKKE